MFLKEDPFFNKKSCCFQVSFKKGRKKISIFQEKPKKLKNYDSVKKINLDVNN